MDSYICQLCVHLPGFSLSLSMAFWISVILDCLVDDDDDALWRSFKMTTLPDFLAI